MKTVDLKKMLNEVSDPSLFKKLINEVYKLVPNNKKLEADLLIKKIIKENVKKDESLEDPFKILSDEINNFLENAYAGHYYVSNKIISKRERYNCGLAFKSFLNKLDEVPMDSKNYRQVVGFYFSFYQLVCNTCRYRMFLTNDGESAFDYLEIKQSDFYKKLVKKVLDSDYTNIDVCNLAILASTGGLNYDSIYEDQQIILISLFKTKGKINTLVNETVDFMKTLNEKLDNADYFSNVYFALQQDINSFNNLLFMCRLKLKEYDKAFDEYFDNSKEEEKEVILYCVLDLTSLFTHDDNLWLKYYEYGVNEKNIVPRDSLKEEYENIIKKQKKKSKH